VAEVHGVVKPASEAVKHKGMRLQRVLVKFAGPSPPVERIQILKAGVLYFAVVFGMGFVLGPIRILCVTPRLGMRMAEL
jgi:hypothetical protein